MTNTTQATPERSLPQLLVRRTVIALVAMALLLVPSIALFAVTGQPSATYAAMGGIIGIVAVLAGGVRFGVLTAVVLGLLAPLSIVAGLSPLTGAALMALMTFAVGVLSRRGLHRAVILVPIFLAWPMLSPIPWLPTGALDEINRLMTKAGLSLAQAVNAVNALSANGGSRPSSTTPTFVTDALIQQRFDTKYLAWIAVFFVVGALVPLLVMPFATRKMHRPEPAPHSRSEAVPYTITITVLTAVATYYFLDHPKMTAGSFLIATILVLTQVGSDIQWKLTVERVLGTFGGVAVLSAIMAVVGTASYSQVKGVPVPLTLYAIGLVFGVATIVAKFSPRQWIYYVLVTPTAALLNAYSTSQAGNFGKQRLVDNLVGAALVIAAALITLGAAHLAKGRTATAD